MLHDYWLPIGITFYFDRLTVFLVLHTFTHGKKVKIYFRNHFTFCMTISRAEQTGISLHVFAVALWVGSVLKDISVRLSC